MAISDYAARQHLNKDFGQTNYSPPATWFVGFKSGGTELSGNGYARIAVTNNTTQWPVISAGDEMTNGATITTPTATPGAWDEADEVALFDASSGGNEWYSNVLDAPFTLAIGQSRSFAAGALRIRLL